MPGSACTFLAAWHFRIYFRAQYAHINVTTPLRLGKLKSRQQKNYLRNEDFQNMNNPTRREFIICPCCTWIIYETTGLCEIFWRFF